MQEDNKFQDQYDRVHAAMLEVTVPPGDQASFEDLLERIDMFFVRVGTN